MSGHTPGPWEVSGKYIEPPNRAHRWICEVPGKPDDEAKANARLIAAAPTLLSALKDAVAALENAYDGEADRAQMLDAIAKANDLIVEVEEAS